MFVTILFNFLLQIIRELREEVERLKQILKIKGFSDSKDEIKEKLTESEHLMEEFTMSWEQKQKNTEIIKQVGRLTRLAT